MKFKACLLTCLLLVAGNASATKKDFLKKVVENLSYGSITQSLVTRTLNNKPIIVFSASKSISIFDVNGSHIKKMDVGPNDRVNSIDVIEDYVVAGNKNGIIKIFDFETGCCTRTWKAHKGILPYNVVVKMVKIKDEIYIISAGEDGTIRVWDMNGNCKKVFTYKDGGTAFKLFVAQNINSGTLKIHTELSQSKAAKFDWNYEKEQYSKEENYFRDGAIMCLLGNDLVVCRGGTTVRPEISVVDPKEKDFEKRIVMEYHFGGDWKNPWGSICSIVPVPTTNYLYVFFEQGNVVLFDWKNKKIIDEFSMGNGKEVVSGGLLPFNGMLYVIVGFKDGSVKTKQLFSSDYTNLIIKQ